MKIAPLLVASASALETSTSATSLLAAIGKRNVTQMESLIQGLAEESVNTPAWKFDKDIRDALEAVRGIFVSSIQTALIDQHRVDQEAHNSAVKNCWGDCHKQYTKSKGECDAYTSVCHKKRDEHVTCRTKVYKEYKDMAKKCGKLHCFEPPKIECEYDDCICPDLLNCHYGHKTFEKDAYGIEVAKYECLAKDGECKSGWGAWLQRTIRKYKSAYAEWEVLWQECSDAYRSFLYIDVECDGTQREFEKCMCEKDLWRESICTTDFYQCQQQCWSIYETDVPNLQCQEKDRKIDWSATKKIECYLDVLMEDFTEEKLIALCGTKTCINEAREAAYKRCGTICPKVDYDGEWGHPFCNDEGDVEFLKGDGHPERSKRMSKTTSGKIPPYPQASSDDQYFLGDMGPYKDDMNGPHVHTDHRTLGMDREKEMRCTEHLDIDFQIPPYRECPKCDPTKEVCEVCDASFHCVYYEQFDQTSKIGCITDCCPEGGGGCFEKVTIESCSAVECDESGHNCEASNKYSEYSWMPSTTDITFGEHTHAWAYNRCECQKCSAKIPSYPTHPGGEREKCSGVHTWHNGGGAYGGSSGNDCPSASEQCVFHCNRKKGKWMHKQVTVPGHCPMAGCMEPTEPCGADSHCPSSSEMCVFHCDGGFNGKGWVLKKIHVPDGCPQPLCEEPTEKCYVSLA